MYEIIENSNGFLLRIYETLEQAEMFCNKFKGYHFVKVETGKELKKEITMENEETKLLPAHAETSEVGSSESAAQTSEVVATPVEPSAPTAPVQE